MRGQWDIVRGWVRAGCLVAGGLGLLGPQQAWAADEVWLATDNYQTVRRYQTNTAFINQFNTGGQNGSSMAVVGNEVWLATYNYQTVRRYDFDGIFINQFNTGGQNASHLAVVGTEVWLSTDNYQTIRRYRFNTDFIDQFNTGGQNGQGMAVVGNELWLATYNYQTIRRYGFDTTFIAQFNTGGQNAASLAVVGNEVWLATDNYQTVRRYQFDTTFINQFSTGGQNASSLAVVGNTVWLSTYNYQTIRRYAFDTIFIDQFNTGGQNAKGLVLVAAPDCNSNGSSDFDDIAGPTSEDCNTNLRPDECDIDLASPAPGGPYYCTEECSLDCNNDGTPDECQTDCNTNDIPDDCDLAAMTSDDCNTNAVPDECDIAGPNSDDCNTNQIPDECDIAAASSDDCNENGVADECEFGSGDIYWAGADGGDFTNASNWSPAMVPLSAGNAIFQNSGPLDNRCIVGSGIPGPVCSVSVGASGSGRQVVQIEPGVVLSTNSGTTVSAGGDVRLEGGELAGGPVANTSNSIAGYGEISANLLNAGLVSGRRFEVLSLTGTTVDNESGGRILAPLAAAIDVRSATVLQGGEIEIRSMATIAFEQVLFNGPGGILTLLGGAVGTDAPVGVTNSSGASIGGFGTIDNSLSNDGDMVVIADMQIVGDLANEGTVTIQSGLLTVTGDVSGGGTIIGGFGGRDGAPCGVVVDGDFLPSTRDWHRWDLTSTLVQVIGGSGDEPRLLEVMGPYRGADGVSLPDASLYSIGTLQIGPGRSVVRLVDTAANAGSARRDGGGEALYVRHLILAPGATLDLGGFHLYCESVSPANPRGGRGAAGVIDTCGGGGLHRITY